MSLTRRDFLQRASALGLTVAVLPTLGCAPDDGLPDDGFPRYTWDGDPGPETLFEHGVASGDPLADAVLLWTRLSPGTTDDVEVFVEVSEAPDFLRRVAVGTFTTGAGRDHALTVDQTDLEPGTTYYYRFSALGRTSPVGRTRTLPAGAVDRLRLGVASCSNYGFGYFHAYRHLARRPDVDVVLHLGDYFYEHASVGEGFFYGAFRPLDPPWEVLNLEDYRRRYAHYRKDPDLQELHRQHPMVHAWDDHEFADNPEIGGSANHDPETEGAWEDRVAAALQAYGEWMPTRLDGNKIYRELVFGDLLHVVLTDRQRRFLWPGEADGTRYLGAEQTTWVLDRIAGVTAPWLLFCTATSFTSRSADGDLGSTFNGSPWDPTSRREILDAVADAGIENLVVVCGDLHKAQALDVAHDPTVYDPATGEGSEGVELACGSVASPGLPSGTGDAPHFFWTEHGQRTYLLLDVTPERLQAEFWGYEDALKEQEELPPQVLLKAYTSAAGSHHLVETSTATTDKADAPALAP